MRNKIWKKKNSLTAILLSVCLLSVAAACAQSPESTGAQEQTGLDTSGTAETESKGESSVQPQLPFADGSTGSGSSSAWELADGLTDGFDPGYSDRDKEGSFDGSGAVRVTLSDSGIQTGGAGVSAEGGTVTIQAAGVYLFSGSVSDGRIIVDIANAGSDDKVQIVLDNVDITCGDGPAVWVKSADKVFLTLPANTANTLTDAGSYTETESQAEAAGSDVPNAAVWSDCDLTINGSGSLTVNGQYNNGIATKDDLVITGGTLTVMAVNNGLKGKDGVAVCGGLITVTAGGDAIKSDQDNSVEKGWVSIDGGTLVLQAGEKGVSAQNDIYVTAGEITVDSGDDAVHANDSVRIAGGVLTLTSQEKGIHADNILSVDGGQITVLGCSEGMEAKAVIINGGETDITASDDGVNASDGNSMGGAGGRGGFGQMGNMPAGDTGAEAFSVYIEINGGILRVKAQGDGIDSNGALMVNGGEIYVDGPTGGGDGALDYAGTASITGGTVVAVGSAGMAGNFTAAQNQCAWMITASSAQKAGSTITLTAENGTVLLTYTPSKEYQSIVVSCPGLTQGGTYTLAVDGTVLETATLTDMVSGSGGMMGGHGGGFGGDMGSGRGGKTGRDMPSGEMPTGEMPTGEIPTGEMPDGKMPGGKMPNGEIPGGNGM